MTVAASVLRQARRLGKAWPLAVVAGAAAFVLPRLLRRRRVTAVAPPLQPGATAFSEAGRTERQAAEILSLAAALVSTRDAATDIERVVCLRRASEIVLGTEPLISRFVEVQTEGFLRRYSAQSRLTSRACEQCGASMVLATQHDASLEDWLPVWKCDRCGAQAAR